MFCISYLVYIIAQIIFYVKLFWHKILFLGQNNFRV
nr:MAG TPA: hypothetical protein [Caudoviricetes sp.]